MNMQELVDKFANGTISDAEKSELYAAAESDLELQGKLSELEKVDDLLNFTKSEESKRLFGYLNKVEATVLATMATSVPIAASHSGWWYGAAGTVGGLAVAGAIWLMSTTSNEPPAAPQNMPVAEQQAPATENIAPPKEVPEPIAEPASKETKKPEIASDNADKHTPSKESPSLIVNGKPGGNNDVSPELNIILTEISNNKGNMATLADRHFKAAMLYKDMKNNAETKSHLTQARTCAQSIHLSETAAKALAEIAIIEYDEGSITQAQQKLSTAVSELKAINSPVVKRWERKLSELR